MPCLVILPTINTLWKELVLSCTVEKQPCSYCLFAEQILTGVSQKKEYVLTLELMLHYNKKITTETNCEVLQGLH